MKKICYVTTISESIKAFFLDQLQYLSENDFDVTVICSYDSELQFKLGDKINYIPVEIPRGFSFFGMIKAIAQLIELFKKEKFELVQYSTPNASFCAAIAAKITKIKIRNYHLMGLRFEGNRGLIHFLLKMSEKLTCYLSTHIECVSNSNLKKAISYKLFSSNKATVVWKGSSGGVNLNRFNIKQKNGWREYIREQNQIPNDVTLFGFVGRITKDKGIDELLSSFRKLHSELENTMLIIVGNFESEQHLNQEYLYWAKHSDSVVFIPAVNDVEKYFAAMDVLVLPSYREGFGNVVIEAGAMGIPVIVSNIEGPIDAMVNNKTGIVVEPKNSQDLFLGMLEIMKNSKREIYSQNAIGYVKEHFDSEVLSAYILERKKLLFEKYIY